MATVNGPIHLIKTAWNYVSVEKIGFACNDNVGNTSVTNIDVNTNDVKVKIHNTQDWI